MNRFSTILFIALLVFFGYKLYRRIERQVAGVMQEGEKVTDTNTGPSVLTGMPPELEASWERAARMGPGAMSNWLSLYGSRVRDPRLAWIQLDYCERVAWANPAEAKRIFNEVRNRAGTNSAVYARIKRLEAAFR